MIVFRDPYEAGRWAGGPVIAIGKFDAVHLGHKKMIEQAVSRARELSRRCLIVTFDPLPQQYFSPGSEPLLPLDDRLKLLGELGADAVLLLPFNGALACAAPEAFARNILRDTLATASVFVGANFCFGKDRAGTLDTLRTLGQECGFEVHGVPLLVLEGEVVSTSAIRALLRSDRRADAERLLGRPL